MKILSRLCILALTFISFQCFSTEKTKVERVIDGDTIKLNDGRKVRLIGIDTPEVHESKKMYLDSKRTKRDMKTIRELGMRASAFTKKMINEEEIELEFDPVNQRFGHRDKYGRILAYVHFECDELPEEYIQFLKKTGQFKKFKSVKRLMLNRLILQSGYANAYTRFPFKYMEDFKKQEKQARLNSIGLWGPVKGLNGPPESKIIARFPVKTKK